MFSFGRKNKPELCIGVTSWNSERFLDVCLHAINKTTKDVDCRVIVLDNCSTDESASVAKKHSAELISKKIGQTGALNILLNRSNAQYTLLIHADTVLLDEGWFPRIIKKMTSDTALVSPEDIGCGLMSREHGQGHPESSFMFFATDIAKQCRDWKITRRILGVPVKAQALLNFDGPHLTHGLVDLFAKHNKKVTLLKVLYSNVQTSAVYQQPKVSSSEWLPALAHLDYGLGNFYTIDGVVSHYHNWYDRVSVHRYMRDAETTEPDNKGYPVEFVKQYTDRFIQDYYANELSLPSANQANAKVVIDQYSSPPQAVSQ